MTIIAHPEDDILSVATTSDGRLIITIGAKTLAHATQIRLDEQHAQEVQGDSYESPWRVIDPEEWARSVCAALEKEEEDGTTFVHLMLDKAIDYAMEQGYEGVAELGDEPESASEERVL